jgi:hypothetical protein
MLKQAMQYFDRGWSIMPLQPRSKDPMLSWKQYQTRRAGEGKVKRWWKQCPEANIGIVTGAISGLIVLDIDSMLALETVKEKGVAKTPIAATGKGYHVYFSHPGFSVKNATSLAGVKGLDVRGDGGYVVAPPSLHPSGRQYMWTSRGLNVPLAPCPSWIINAVSSENSNNSVCGELGWPRLLCGVKHGCRNDTATRLIGHWLGLGLPEEEVWVLIREWNAKNRPPLEKKELGKVFQSICRREAKKKMRKSHRDNVYLPGRVVVPKDWDGGTVLVTSSWDNAREAYLDGLDGQQAVVVAHKDGTLPLEAVQIIQRASDVQADKTMFWQVYPLLMAKRGA